MGRKRKRPSLLMCLMAASTVMTGILGSVPLPVKAAEDTMSYEARIGETHYGELEEAFVSAQAGDTITVLKDCRVSGTLEVTMDNITLQSEDAGTPVTVSRDEEFTGIRYSSETDTVLVAVKGSGFSTRDIILDGGAELDDDFNNSGKVWNSPLVYVTGAYEMGSGTVLQNNYNTDGFVSSTGATRHTGGALHVMSGGSLSMDGGLIRNCYSSGAGGGVQSVKGSVVTAESSTVRDCYATWGGGMSLWGEAELSGMTFTGNVAGSSGGALCSTAPLTVTDSLIEGNRSAYDGGGICTSTGHRPKFIRCTFTGNTAPRGSAIQTTKGEGPDPLEIHDCTFTGNRSAEKILAGGTICYMNETGIILFGNIVMEDNLTAGVSPCDICFMYNVGASILLDESFESDSTFVIGGGDNITPGRILIDGKFYHKDPSTEQFVWHTDKYCTERRGEDLYLAEVPEKYFIGYDANNKDDVLTQSYIDPVHYTNEEPVIILNREEVYPYMGSFEKKGFDFVCWNTRKNGTGTDYPGGVKTHLTANLYLYAKWKVKEPVTLTYVYNGGTGAKDSEQATPELEFTFPEAERSGYSFKGWYKDEELAVFAGNAGDTYDAPEEDTTYYAAWEKAEATVTFDADGGKMEGGDITAKIGDTITLPACTKDGYEFAGWYNNDSCVGNAGEEYTVTGDVTLKAHYIKKEAPTCIVTFDTDGGKELPPVKVEQGQAIRLPEAEKENHIFLGWYTEKQGGEKTNTEIIVTEDITLYACWEKEAEKPEERPEATITFDADGGKMEGGDVTAKVGDTITLPACTKDGYEFAGWYDNDTCVGNAGDEYTVTEDVTLKAHYIKQEAPTCIVTFDTDGGKEISPVKVEQGQAIRLPEAEKENHIFLGWYTEKEGGEKADTELTVTEDLTLYARWEKEAEKPEERPEATVTFDADGGKMEGGDVIAKVGDTITLPACTKDGYEFAGWYDNDTCVGNAGEEYTVTGDVTLKARYEKKAETTCLITFDPNGGRKAEHIRAAKGEKITLPGTEKSGYVFLGWYTEKEGGILLGIAGDELEVTKDMTVYALWEKENAGQTGDEEPETCKAVFHTEGGTLKNTTLTVIKGAGLYLPLPEKEGFDFAGWYLDKSLTQFAGTYRDAYRITKDMDFYAKWEKAKEDNSDTNDSKDDDTEQDGNAKNYTVKYDANGGTVKESSVKVEKGKTVKLPSAEREGFSFKGWYTDQQVFIGKAGSIYKPEEDITLFAKWEKVTSGDNSEDKKDSDSKTETSGTDTDKNAGTSPSDNRSDKKSGTSTADSNSDEKTDSGAGTQKEPVIQTGRTTPIYLFAVLGMTGVLLAALSIHEGKRSSKK